MAKWKSKAAVATTVVAATAAYVIMKRLRRSKKQGRVQASKLKKKAESSISHSCDEKKKELDGTTGKSRADISAEERAELVKDFEDAAKMVSNLNRGMTESDKLMLYGLYKQSILGERDEANVPKPSRIDMVGWAKYEAWGKFNGISKMVAMVRYIEVVRHFSEQGDTTDVTKPSDDNADIIYDDDEECDDDDGCKDAKIDETTFQVFGMGSKPSTLAYSEDDTFMDEGDNSSPSATLMMLATKEDATALKSFLDDHEDIDVNEADKSGQTALHFAADHGCADSVQVFLNSGADPSASDEDGISVLHTAVFGGHVSVAKILISAGADIDVKDSDGNSARSWAKDDGDSEMKELFREISAKEGNSVTVQSENAEICTVDTKSDNAEICAVDTKSDNAEICAVDTTTEKNASELSVTSPSESDVEITINKNSEVNPVEENDVSAEVSILSDQSILNNSTDIDTLSDITKTAITPSVSVTKPTPSKKLYGANAMSEKTELKPDETKAHQPDLFLSLIKDKSSENAERPRPIVPSSPSVSALQANVDVHVARLLQDIRRIGTEGEPYTTFGELFDDEDVQEYYEALVGTLKSAKKRGFIDFKGQMLLKGMHDNVRITIKEESC